MYKRQLVFLISGKGLGREEIFFLNPKEKDILLSNEKSEYFHSSQFLFGNPYLLNSLRASCCNDLIVSDPLEENSGDLFSSLFKKSILTI